MCCALFWDDSRRRCCLQNTPRRWARKQSLLLSWNQKFNKVNLLSHRIHETKPYSKKYSAASAAFSPAVHHLSLFMSPTERVRGKFPTQSRCPYVPVSGWSEGWGLSLVFSQMPPPGYCVLTLFQVPNSSPFAPRIGEEDEDGCEVLILGWNTDVQETELGMDSRR